MKPRFSSFEEIDSRLELLSVQRQLSLSRLQLFVRESPGRIIREGFVNTVRPALTNIAIDWTLHRLKRFRRKLTPQLSSAS